MKDILSQAEIDALLGAARSAEPEVNDTATPFDLASRRRIRKEALPGIERLNQRFAEQFRASLSRLLGRGTEVIAQPPQYSSFAAYQHSLYVPSSLTLMRLTGLAGSGLLMADARLVFRMVDLLFGGSGRGAALEGRDFSVAEQRLIARFSELLIEDLGAAWAPLVRLGCEISSREVNPVMAVIAAGADAVLINRFVVDSGGVGGEFHLVFPMATLEPLREALLRPDLLDRPTADPRWKGAIKSAVLDTEVATSCALGDKTLPLSQLAALKAGDVIAFGPEDMAVFKAAGLPLFRGRLGIVDDKLALKLTRALMDTKS